MKGYKVFNPDWTCRGFQYEVGKTYETDDKLKMCEKGFHFCKVAVDCFNYYQFDSKNKVAEVIAHGEVVEDWDKCVTNKLEIVREIEWHEVLSMVNMGKDNTGHRNTGDCNTGDRNTGHRNTGDRNTGHRNTGNRNTGDCNTGDCNTGDWNTGDMNTGDMNTGDWNTGDWNKTDYSSGCFCTEEATILFFDLPSDWSYQDWIDSYQIGILYRMPTENRQSWWNQLSEKEKKSIKSLPNFNAQKFHDITGIEVD